MDSITSIGLCFILIILSDLDVALSTAVAAPLVKLVQADFSTLVMPDISGDCFMASFYLELGCSPAPSDDNSTSCPVAFTCPDLHPDPNMCYYRGVPYADRASIPQNLIRNPCSQACNCRVSGKPRFDCAAVDCVETFDSDAENECVSTFELDSCCRTGSVCGKDAIAKLKTCEVDGKTYYEGQSFEPAKTRKTCICTPEWDGNVDNRTYCRDINCGLEIHYQEMLSDNCAPKFVGNERSCPIGFQCPSPTTKIIRGLNIRDIKPECVFGNDTLKVGDEVTADEKCMKCSCKVPPFVSCSRLSTCD